MKFAFAEVGNVRGVDYQNAEGRSPMTIAGFAYVGVIEGRVSISLHGRGEANRFSAAQARAIAALLVAAADQAEKETADRAV